MKTPEISVTCPLKRYADLPDYLKKYYNKPINTSKTIKKPFYCPNGKAKCGMCRKNRKGDHKQKSKNYEYFYSEKESY